MNETIELFGEPVRIATDLVDNGFRTEILPVTDMSNANSQELFARAQTWTRARNAGMDNDFVYCRQGNAHAILIDSNRWQPAEHDWTSLRQALQTPAPAPLSATAATPGTDWPAGTGPAPGADWPLRRHDLPAGEQDPTPAVFQPATG